MSLIESLVALGLFAVSAATMGQYLVSHIRLGATNYLYTQAYIIAEEQLESTRALRFNDMEPSEKVVTIDQQKFNVTTDIVDDSPANGLKEITVNVEWVDPLGPQNVAVRTIYTEVQR